MLRLVLRWVFLTLVYRLARPRGARRAGPRGLRFRR